MPPFPLFRFFTPAQEKYQVRTIDSIDLEKESKSAAKHFPANSHHEAATSEESTGEELPSPTSASDEPSKSGAAQQEQSVDSTVPAVRSVILTLADARASALESNLDVRVEQINPAIARQVVSQEAGRFEATFNTSYVRNRVDLPPGALAGGPPDTTFDIFTNSITQPLVAGGELRAIHDFTKADVHDSSTPNAVDTDLGVEYRQPLLRGFGYLVNTSRIQIARAHTGVADARSKLTAIRVLADVERAYWRLYAANEFHAIALRQLALAKQQYEATRRLVEAGLFTNVDALVAESGVMVRENAAIQAETNVRILQRDLKRIMQRPDAPVDGAAEIKLSTEPNPVELELDRATLAARGVGNRMEMLELQLRLMADSIERGVQENSVLPRLDFRAEIDALGLDSSYRKSMEVLFDNDFGDRLVGIALEVPLSGNVSARARLREVQLRMIRNRIEQQRVAVIITQEVFDAVDRVEQNWERIVVTRRAEFSAERAFQGQVRLQETGRQTITDVLVALQNLGEAKVQAVQAITDYQIAKVELALAVGAMLGYGQLDWDPCCGPQSPLLDYSDEPIGEQSEAIPAPESERLLPLSDRADSLIAPPSDQPFDLPSPLILTPPQEAAPASPPGP